MGFLEGTTYGEWGATPGDIGELKYAVEQQTRVIAEKSVAIELLLKKQIELLQEQNRLLKELKQ